MRHFLLAIREGLVEHYRFLLSVVAVGLVAVTVIQLVSYFAASQPRTCASCHIMEPYVDAWHTSTHKDVTCVTCHAEWRFALSKTYLTYAMGIYTTHLRAEVPDARCLKCHEHQELDTDEVFLKNIRFSHKNHLGEMRRGKRLHCTSCHTGHTVMGTGSSEGVKPGSDVDESVCFTCHFKGAEKGQAATGCLVCHGPPTTVVTHQGFQFDHGSYLKRDVRCDLCHVEVTRGDANVPRDRCTTCHVSRIEAYGDSERVHEIHLRRHEIDCARCHNRMEHGKVAMAPALGERCDACHKPSHTAQEQMYIGVGGQGVPDSPSTMFLARVACDSCHGEPGGDPRKGAEELRKSCVTCHGQGFDRMVDDWVNGMGVLVVDVTRVVQDAEAAARRVRGGEQRFKDALARARHNLDFVRQARGEHNIRYAVELLREARREGDSVLTATGNPTPPPPTILASQAGYCRVCHSTSHLGTELEFQGLQYDHNRHLAAGLACDTCHSLENHGTTTITLAGCMSCHHGSEQKKTCVQCHADQASFYSGSLPGTTVKGDPDVMAQAEVGCADCHDLSSTEPLVKTVQKACEACHEAGYGDMLVEWINEDQERVQELALLVARGRTQVEGESGALAASHRQSLATAERIYNQLLRVKGVHNTGLAADAAQQAKKLLAWESPAAH